MPASYEISVACRSDIHRIWEAIADSDRLNRLMGMSPVVAQPTSDATAARYLVSTNLGGLPAVYEERPFEWVSPTSLRLLRRMRSGALRSLEVVYALAPRDDGGTTVSLRLTLEPRVALLSPFLGLMATHSLKRLQEAIRALDKSLAAGEPMSSPRSTAPQAAALARAEHALRDACGEAHHALVDQLIGFVSRAGDLEVSRIRPFALADDWGEDRLETLGVCLTAVRAGLLELRWEVVCPSCRTATDVLPTLAALSDHGACHLCDLDFAIDLEDAVEATFAPSRSVRVTDRGPYCISGPARTPHVVSQAILPAAGAASLACPAELGRYRLFVRGGATAPVEVQRDAPAEVRARWPAAPAAPLLVAPGGSILVDNDAVHERHVKLERVNVLDQAARARVVTAMPAFRRDFSGDVLRPGLALKVARVGLFFSDLTGSTQLYSDVGDAAAFKLVHDHFDLVRRIVEEHRGALVKTIGDAVMAVFADDLDGLVASVAILRAFDGLHREGDRWRHTQIRLGVFGGPCYVVTANGVLDYFGQTVNIAARLQGAANGGELVVERALAERAVGAKAIPEACVVERGEAKLKGVASCVEVARIRVASAPRP